MKLLLRRPGLYLVPHWIATLALAAVLLVPHGSTGPVGHTITLLTGQVVHLNADGSPQPAGGLTEVLGSSATDSLVVDGTTIHLIRAGTANGFEGDALQGDTFAYPPAAQNAIGPFLDPRLFDVTYLERQGYDDQARPDVPVIVAFANHDLAVQAVHQGTVEGGIHLTHAFEYGPFAMGYVSKGGPFVPAALGTSQEVLVQAQGEGFASTSSVLITFNNPESTETSVDPGSGRTESTTGIANESGTVIATDQFGITGIYLDGTVHEAPDGQTVAPTLDSSLPLIGAPAARARGLTGKGVKIAVVDTGIDDTHPDLQGRVIAAKNFSSDSDTIDHFGHGTHVAGIAAGTGAASDGKYGGVAPQASLINAKALSKSGSGTESGIMRAMDWAADQGARIENMSLGGTQSDGTDPLSREVNSITQKKNVLFAIAAGNAGPTRKVSTPAAADLSLAVGAVDKTPAMAVFSSRGPRLKDMALKPDIVAPGVQITAPRANHGSGSPYATYSGTSMATPMIAGSAALIAQLHPGWSAMQIKHALMSAAAPLGANDQSTCVDSMRALNAPCHVWMQASPSVTVATGPDIYACNPPVEAVERRCTGQNMPAASFVSAYDQGAGLVDLKAMVNQVAFAEPAGLSFNIINADEQRDQALAIRNISTEALTVTLQGSLHGPDGALAAGLEFDSNQLTVPAGGSATLKVTLRGPSKVGPYSGDIVFVNQANGERVARAAVAFVVQKGS